MPAATGQVQTVLGAIAPDAMGITLPHEHLLIDFKAMFAEPSAASDKGRAAEPVGLTNLGWVRQNFNANLDNLVAIGSCRASPPARSRARSLSEKSCPFEKVGWLPHNESIRNPFGAPHTSCTGKNDPEVG